MKAGHVLTETSAADQLHEFRAAQPDFIEESFTTISAYGANASMPHYHPDHEHPVVIENRRSVSRGLRRTLLPRYYRYHPYRLWSAI